MNLWNLWNKFERISQACRISTFFCHGCCQGALHVIGQEGCGGVVDPVSDHHGYQVTGCADGVEGRGGAGEILVSCVRGDPEQQTWCHLQSSQACISCVMRKQTVNNTEYWTWSTVVYIIYNRKSLYLRFFRWNLWGHHEGVWRWAPIGSTDLNLPAEGRRASWPGPGSWTSHLGTLLPQSHLQHCSWEGCERQEDRDEDGSGTEL